jgi:hypothetical protein
VGAVDLSAKLQAAGLVLLGLLLLLIHRRFLGSILLASGILLLVTISVYPPLERIVQHGNKKLSSLAALAIAWALLAPFYLILFSLAHAVLAFQGKDPLRLKFPSAEATYWVPVSADDGEHPRRLY